MSFDAETALPAAGGAAIAIAFGTQIAPTLSAVFEGLGESLGDASSAIRHKRSFEGFCLTGGSADLEGELARGNEVTLTLRDCAGSPLSSTAANGRLLLEITSVGIFSPTEVRAEMSFAGLEDGGDFTIASVEGGEPTELSSYLGTIPRLIDVPEGEEGDIFSSTKVELSLGDVRRDGFSEPYGITVSEATRSLDFGCFEINTRINRSTSSIEQYLLVVATLSLNEENVSGELVSQVYWATTKEPRIGFPEGSAVPDKGSLELRNGVGTPCRPFYGLDEGDNSQVTATFMPDGLVSLDVVDAEGACLECTTTWENLLTTLSDIASPDQCMDATCPGTGGDNPPVIYYVAWEYPAGECVLGPTALTITVNAYDEDDPTGEGLTYTGSVFSCMTDILIANEPRPVQQTLPDCIASSPEDLTITVSDGENSDEISAMWESITCPDGCNTQDTSVCEDAPDKCCPADRPADR